jgi:hypothetical protein
VGGDIAEDGGLDQRRLGLAARFGQRELVGPAGAEHPEANPAQGRRDRGANDAGVGIRLVGADLATDFDRRVRHVGQPPVLGGGQRPGAEADQPDGDHRRGQDGQQQAGGQQASRP